MFSLFFLTPKISLNVLKIPCYCKNYSQCPIICITPSSQDTLFFQEVSRKEEHIITALIDFALMLMTGLEQINRDAFQRFKLRVGKF